MKTDPATFPTKPSFNLFAFICLIRVCKKINVGDELLVWYSDGYDDEAGSESKAHEKYFGNVSTKGMS